MYIVFNKSCIGYSHIRNKKPCQDYSASYKDNERIIITCCDGHGGAQYVRSQYGSKAASDATMDVFKTIDKSFLRGLDDEQIKEKIKLLILCEYNKLIERELTLKPIRKNEVAGLREEQIDMLRFNPSKAYGTTLSGVLLYKKRIYVVSIGDTETLGIRNGEIVKIFDNSNDPAGNVTYSMCQEDAYQYLRVAVLDAHELDGIFLCTDGMSSPYQSYENLNKSFLCPTVRKVIHSRSTANAEIAVEKMALVQGVGDDVSLSFIISDKAKIKYYR